MDDLSIDKLDDLPTVAFKVCTALARSKVRAILTGGSATTVYAPEAYQSRDLDFIAYFAGAKGKFDEVLASLGYARLGRVHSNPDHWLTLEFPDDEILIGQDFVKDYVTLVREELILNILTPTDCVRDRLCSYYFWNSHSALEAAIGVARRQQVDLEIVRAWSEREGMTPKFENFRARLT